MTSTYTASTVVDVVEAIPTLFGFAVTESFVAIVTNGPRSRFGFRMRLDLPEVEEAAEAGELIARHLNRNAGDGVVLIAFSARYGAADALMADVVGRLVGATIVAAVRADDANVWQYDADGRPDYGASVLARPKGVSAAVVQAVAAGQQMWSSREELAAMFEPAPVLKGISEAAAAVESDAAALERLALDATALLEEAGEVLDLDDARLLATAAQVVVVRDAIWATITRETAEKDAEIWRIVATMTAGPAAAGPYALAAFGYWLAGDGGRANMAVDQALSADADHSMASLVCMVLTGGINPDSWTGLML